MAHKRSFYEFLHGYVDIQTGRITGRQALFQIAAMPVALAVAAIAILGCAAEAGVTSVAQSAVQSAPPATTTSIAASPSTVAGEGVTLHSLDVSFPDGGRLFPGGDKADAINNN